MQFPRHSDMEPLQSPKSPRLPTLSNKTSPFRTPSSASPRTSQILQSRSEKLPYISMYPSLSPRGFAKAANKKLELLKVEPTKVSATRCGNVRVFAANTHNGISRHHNEDRVRIILNIKKPEHFTEEKWPPSSFYALYDGNSGKQCADYLKENLHSYIFADPNFPCRPKQAITSAFLEADTNFLENAQESNDFSGSCALICIIIGNRCFIGNCGSSRAVLSAGRGIKVLQLTEEHTSFNESEQQRVIASGGKLISNFIMDGGIRIDKGAYKIVPGNLFISRSLGNFPAKIEKYGGNPGVLISTPSIKGITILDEYDFILLCSNSIFNHLSNQEVVDAIWRGIHNCQSPEFTEKIAAGIDELLNEAIYRRSEENLTVLLIGFKSLKKYIEKCD